MKDISILFNFNENDFASYNINIGEQAYQVNHDSSSINLCVDNHSSMNLSYKPERLTVNKIIIDFILELIKIPLKMIFELTSNNKWYYESHLYKFNCDVKVNTDNLNEFKLQIINPTLKNNNQNIIKPYLICFYFLLCSNQNICFHCYRYFTVFCSTFRIVNKKIYGNKKSGAIFVAKQVTAPCYAKADPAKVKSRPYDLLFPAPLR